MRIPKVVTLELFVQDNRASEVVIDTEEQKVLSKVDFSDSFTTNPWCNFDSFYWVNSWLRDRQYQEGNINAVGFYPEDLPNDIWNKTLFTNARVSSDTYWVRIKELNLNVQWSDIKWHN